MKLFKFALIFVFCFITTSCKYDDREIWDFVHKLDNRLTTLENVCKEMNTNISSLKQILISIQDNDFITSVIPIKKDGKTVGYTITFEKSSPITIYNGEDGKDGVDGKDAVAPKLKIENDYWYISTNGGISWEKLIKATGENGKDGVDGKDAIAPKLKIENDYWYISTNDGVSWEKLIKATGENGKDGRDGSSPNIGIAKDMDGYYYWTCNGSWLLDKEGNKIKTTGENGNDGKDGEDAIPPKLKIENGYWYISTDNQISWTMLGKATGEDGKDGQNGEDGKDSNCIFSNVVYYGDYAYFYLSDGTLLTIPLASYKEENDEKFLNGHQYIDLDLPSGTMWATVNIGADKEEDLGSRFAWGETTPKTMFGSVSKPEKYNDGDGLLMLEDCDDAAHVNWGEGWKIPTVEQIKELYEKCQVSKTSISSVEGRKFKGPNGKSIFIPDVEAQSGATTFWSSEKFAYWSRNLHDKYKQNAYYGYWGGSPRDTNRGVGMMIRPVCQKN